MIKLCTAGVALLLLSGCATAPLPKTMPAHHRAPTAHHQAAQTAPEPVPPPIVAPAPTPAPPVHRWRWFH